MLVGTITRKSNAPDISSRELWVCLGYTERQVGNFGHGSREMLGKYRIHGFVSDNCEDWYYLGEVYADDTLDAGARDASLVYYKGRYVMSLPSRGNGQADGQQYLIKTSRDFVHWTDAAVSVDVNTALPGGPSTLNAYSAEFYCDSHGLPHLLCPIANAHTQNDGADMWIYETHPTADDCSSWSAPALIYSGRSVYDPAIYRSSDGTLHLWLACSNLGGVIRATGMDFSTPFVDADITDSLGWNSECATIAALSWIDTMVVAESQVPFTGPNGEPWMIADPSVGNGILYKRYTGNIADYPGTKADWTTWQALRTPFALSGASITRFVGQTHWETFLPMLVRAPKLYSRSKVWDVMPREISGGANPTLGAHRASPYGASGLEQVVIRYPGADTQFTGGSITVFRDLLNTYGAADWHFLIEQYTNAPAISVGVAGASPALKSIAANTGAMKRGEISIHRRPVRNPVPETVGTGGAAAGQKEIPCSNPSHFEIGDTVHIVSQSDSEVMQDAIVDIVGANSITVRNNLVMDFVEGDLVYECNEFLVTSYVAPA